MTTSESRRPSAKKPQGLYARLCWAAARGQGVRLTYAEICTLARDEAIQSAAWDEGWCPECLVEHLDDTGARAECTAQSPDAPDARQRTCDGGYVLWAVRRK